MSGEFLKNSYKPNNLEKTNRKNEARKALEKRYIKSKD